MSISLVTGAIGTVGAGLAALGGLALFQLGQYRRAPRRRPEEDGSPGVYQPPGVDQAMERYQPMLRLLAGEDANFIRGNTGCPKIAARWEKSRRRIGRLYLQELAADFHRLHAKARVLVAASPEQYAVLVPILFQQKFVFWRTLAIIELRLALGGWNVPQANIRELVGAVEAVQREFARAAAAVSPA
jgi:hypothetical protein